MRHEHLVDPLINKFSRNLQSTCHVQLQTRTNQIPRFQIKHSQPPRKKRKQKPLKTALYPTKHTRLGIANAPELPEAVSKSERTRTCRDFARPVSSRNPKDERDSSTKRAAVQDVLIMRLPTLLSSSDKQRGGKKTSAERERGRSEAGNFKATSSLLTESRTRKRKKGKGEEIWGTKEKGSRSFGSSRLW